MSETESSEGRGAESKVAGAVAGAAAGASGAVWGRRFEGQAREDLFDRFNASIGQDLFLADAEVAASTAYARALRRAGSLTEAEAAAMERGLDRVRARLEAGEATDRFEDVHSAVELLLTEEIGPAGLKLHTGRSRNEQVATDERLWLKAKIPEAVAAVEAAEAALDRLAAAHPNTLWPGYTHMQPAQVVPFPLWVGSYVEPMRRAGERLREALARADVLPLGSGALAGSMVALDREAMRADLGFGGITRNPMDAVSDRTFILDALYAMAVLMLDAGRLAADLILYASRDFGLIAMDAAIATSSSLMPQKKNPDIFELVRAAAGAAVGRLMEMFMTLKGLPSAYNKDLQADKRPLREGMEEPIRVMRVLAAALEHVRPREELPASVFDAGLYATDLVAYLVGKGVPFRQAHGIVGSAAAEAERAGAPLDSFTPEEWRRFSPLFGDDVGEVFNPRRSVELRGAFNRGSG